MRENHASASPVSRPPLAEDPILVAPSESQGSFFLLWFFQADIIENSYSSITHMLLSMHVYFLIITYIHISCIFSELISQYASVRMTQFFYILIYSIHMKVYCYCLTLNCCYQFPTVTVQFPTVIVWLWTVTVWLWTVTVWLFQLLLSDFELLLFDFSNHYCLTFPTVTVWLWTVTVWLWTVTVWLWTVTVQFPTVTVWTLIRFLIISKVLKFHFNWDWSRWKAKTRGY